MTKAKRLHGVIPALATPLNQDETIDITGLKKVLGFQIASGVSGIFILGSCGEFARIVDRERTRLINTTVKTVRNRVPVLVGTSDTGTRRVIENIVRVKRMGADAAVVLPPYYYPVHDQQEIVRFFREVAEATDFPLICYHNQYTTNIKMSFQIIKQISRIRNVIGLKDSSGDYDLVKREIRELKDDGFAIFQGDERLFGRSVLYGADGVVSGTASMVPGLMVRMYRSALNKDRAGTARVQLDIMKALASLDRSGMIGIKYGMFLQGLCQSYTCSPANRLNSRIKKKVVKTLKELDIIR
jgi:4-hydroxy-tetrahydrodipicolinate synthase